MDAVARRYAQALIELAQDSGGVAAMQVELGRLGELWTQSPELRGAFENPSLNPDARKALVDAMASKVALTGHTKNFLRLLADRRRMSSVGDIVEAFQTLAEAETGNLRAVVTTAVPLEEAYFGRLQAALESITGKKITIERKQDPSILGGVIATVGGQVFDGSLRSRLGEVRETLITE